MKAKNKLILSLALAVLVVSALLQLKGMNPAPPIAGGLIVIFLVYALFDMPEKHKNYTYEDQRKGMMHSLGGNPPPEVPKPEDYDETK